MKTFRRFCLIFLLALGPMNPPGNGMEPTPPVVQRQTDYSSNMNRDGVTAVADLQQFPGYSRDSSTPVRTPTATATLTPAPTATSTPNTKTIHVHASQVTGELDMVLGVSGNAPVYWDGTDMSTDLHALGVTEIRTHDSDSCIDWYLIFPDWSADPEDPASYNFSQPAYSVISADTKMAHIYGRGFSAYLRLGISWNTRPNNVDWPRYPPGYPDFDPAKWATICKHILMHYNDGWANGFHYGIRYVQIWNEPDGAGHPPGTNRFWKGTPEQFVALYEHAARTLKAYDPNLMVGTCGLSLMNPNDCAYCHQKYFRELVDHCRNHAVPLDFFSWHRYAPPPALAASDYVISAELCREYLGSVGMTHVEQHCTEWNAPGDIHPLHDSVLAAASTASSLLKMIAADVTRTYFHPVYGQWGLLGPGRRWRKKTYAFQAVHFLQRDTPDRVFCDGMESGNFAVMAGRSADLQTVQILISDQDSAYQQLRLAVAGLISDATYKVSYVAVDEAHNLEQVGAETRYVPEGQSSLTVEQPWSAPRVMLVKLRLHID